VATPVGRGAREVIVMPASREAETTAVTEKGTLHSTPPPPFVFHRQGAESHEKKQISSYFWTAMASSTRISFVALLLQGAAGLLVGGPARAAVRTRSAAASMDASVGPTLPGTLDKRAERRRIMGDEKYKRGNAPFDKAIHTDVASKMSEIFASDLVKEMRDAVLNEVTKGEGDQAITFRLAQEYGFCWGVERSIELAWAAREAYPDKRMHITNELIHNPVSHRGSFGKLRLVSSSYSWFYIINDLALVSLAVCTSHPPRLASRRGFRGLYGCAGCERPYGSYPAPSPAYSRQCPPPISPLRT